MKLSFARCSHEFVISMFVITKFYYTVIRTSTLYIKAFHLSLLLSVSHLVSGAKKL
jgi:hypothetical protein